jgi:hypothetical protein
MRRAGRIVEMEPSQSGEPNSWRLRAPVDGPADTPSVTRALAALAHLRAESFAAESVQPSNAKVFGLDQPSLEIAWESERLHRLRIGAPVRQTPSFFASLDDQPYVFTLSAETVGLFEVEFRDHRVLSFPVDRAERVVLRWPHRVCSLRRRRPPPPRGQVEWMPEPGVETEGIDLSRIGSLVATVAQLQTLRYFQYEGAFPAASGLPWPRLVVEIQLGPSGPSQILRIGNTVENGQVCAAIGTAGAGPGFFLPAPPWNELIASGEHFPPIPEDPFAPVP